VNDAFLGRVLELLVTYDPAFYWTPPLPTATAIAVPDRRSAGIYEGIMRIGFKRRNRHNNDCRAGADCGRSEALTSRRYADGKKTSGIAASVRTAEPVLSFSLDLA
jgi:hypothetical protein